MKIDKRTLLITDFENIDKEKLLAETRVVIIDGKIGDYFREIGVEWLDFAGLNKSNVFLLSLSTIFPLKLLQSIIDLENIKGD